jgi:hypothetical protein
LHSLTPESLRTRASSATLLRAAVPGDVAIVELGAAALRPSATFGGRGVMVLPKPERQGFWIAVVGLGLAAVLRSGRRSSYAAAMAWGARSHSRNEWSSRPPAVL